MSDNDRFILQLKDFDRNISSGWKGLHNDIDLCDVTLVCDENQIKLHKIVASTCSLALRKIIKNNPHPHPLVYLRGVKYSQLVNLIDFMYQGEIKIPRDEIDDLVSLAKDLQVIGLFENKEEETVDTDVNDAKSICKNIAPEINKVVDINEDIAKNDYTDPLIKSTANPNVDHIGEDNGMNTRVDNNLVSPKFNRTKRTIKESGENTNDTIGRKRNKVEHTFQKNLVSDEQDDIIELGYQEANYNTTFNEMAGIKQHLNYNEDLHVTEKNIESNTKIMETNISEFQQIKFDCGLCNETFSKPSSLSTHITSIHEELNLSCDKCQYTSTQRESLIRHVKTTHYRNSSVKTDIGYKVTDTNKEVEVIDVIENDTNKNSACPSLEIDIVTQNIATRLTQNENLGFKDEETAKEPNVKIGSEQNKIKPSSNNEVGYEQQDITEIVLNNGYESRNHSDIPLQETVSPKQNVNCTKNLYENINNILNGFPDHYNNPEFDEISIKSSKNKFDCGQCYMKFSEPSDLSTHIKSIHETHGFSCDVCPYIATESENLINHIKNVHNINLSLETVGDNNYILNRQKSETAVHDRNPSLQDILEEVMDTSEDVAKKNNTNLSLTLDTEDINEDSSYIPQIRTAVEESSEDFNLAVGDKQTIHEETDNIKLDITYKSKECPEQNEGISEEIYKNVNKSELPVYDNNTEQEEDIEVNLNEPLKNNQKCGQCDMEFNQVEALARHIKSIHKGLRFSCDKCQYTATQSFSLVRHVRSVHDKIRYSCNLCDYSTTQKPILNKHIKMKH